MKIGIGKRAWRPVAVMILLAVMAFVQGELVPKPVSAQLPEVPHYKCYGITDASPGVSVNLQTQFGVDQDVVVGPASSLCLPAVKNDEGSLVEPHVKCYDIGPPPDEHIVRLENQFGWEGLVTLSGPTQLCIPANKAISPEQPSPVVPLAPHYACYDIVEGGSDPPVTVNVVDQFYPQGEPATVGLATRLCLPALKNGEGDLTVPHVECYQITGPAPDRLVNLLTQFGDEINVPVEPPEELCVPTIKYNGEHTGVGGVQALPDAPTDTGSGNTMFYAAVSVAGLVALVAVTGSGWYARRRWLR